MKKRNTGKTSKEKSNTNAANPATTKPEKKEKNVKKEKVVTPPPSPPTSPAAPAAQAPAAPAPVVEEKEDNEWNELIDSVENPEKALDFFLAPLTLERLILFGSLISADSFLFTIALLPFRVIWRIITGKFLKSHAARIDVARFLLIIVTYALMPSLNLGSVSSLVKKSELKLKLVWATLEFLNCMLADWNTTILGSFFWSLNPANAGRRKYPLILHFAVSVGYLVLHTVIVTLYLGVVNLAITTSNRTFLGLIFIVQFAEMKSAATKSMSPDKIVNESIGDITERFQTFIYVILLFISNFNFAGPFDMAVTKELISDLSIVYFSELAVDCIKHTSILRTNSMSPAIYTVKNNELMANFVATSSPSAIIGDKSTKTSRSMGFCAIPLTIVTFKVLISKFAPDRSFDDVVMVLGCTWVAAVVLKVVLFAVASVVSRITVFTPIERLLGIAPDSAAIPTKEKKGKDKIKTK